MVPTVAARITSQMRPGEKIEFSPEITIEGGACAAGTRTSGIPSPPGKGRVWPGYRLRSVLKMQLRRDCSGVSSKDYTGDCQLVRLYFAGRICTLHGWLD